MDLDQGRSSDRSSANASVLHQNLLPQSLEAERSVLSCIVTSPESLSTVVELGLKSEDFYLEGHGTIFNACVALFESRRPIDTVSLTQILRDWGNFDEIGGIPTLAGIFNQTFLTYNIEYYARIILDKAKLRNLIKSCQGVLQEAFAGVDNVSEFLDHTETQIFKVTQERQQSDLISIKDVVNLNFKAIEELAVNARSVTGVESGFDDLDRLLTGFHPGQLIVIGARPRMGKTSLALNLALNAARISQKTILFFSLEMTREELGVRLLSSLSRVDSVKLRTGKLDNNDWPQLINAAGILSEAKLFFDDRGTVTPLEIRARARRLKATHGLGMIIIDYLQLIQGSRDAQREGRERVVAEVSRTLKSLAKELEVPILALAQLNRGVESRPDNRPNLGDLRDSGAIEQDADVVMFVYRDEIYDANTPDKGIAELIVAKQRSGPTDTVRLAWNGSTTSFENLYRSSSPPND